MHYANEPRGTQYYTACAQVEIASEGTGVPGPLAKIPGIYEEDDPGILFYRTFLLPYDELIAGHGLTHEHSLRRAEKLHHAGPGRVGAMNDQK